MSILTRTAKAVGGTAFQATTLASAAEVNADFDAIIAWSTDIDDLNVAAAAAIVPDKIAPVGGLAPVIGLYRADINGDLANGGTQANVHLEEEIWRLRYAIRANNVGSTYWYDPPQRLNVRNFVDNGDFRVAQRGVTFDATTTPANDDNTYLLDRWRLLSEANDTVDVTQVTAAAQVPDGAMASIGLDVETADRKFGIFQAISNEDSLRLWKEGNGTCSVSMKILGTGVNTIDDVRIAVLAWDGAVNATDAAHPVAAWNGDTVQPTFHANWTLEGESTGVATTLAWQTVTLNDIDLDTAGTTHIGVFVYSCVDDAGVGAEPTVTEFLYVADVQLTEGSVGGGQFPAKPFQEELLAGQRYFCKSFDYSQEPADAGGGADILEGMLTYYMWGNPIAGETGLFWRFPVEMNATPTIVTYQPYDTLAASQWGEDTNTRDSAASTGGIGTGGCSIYHNGAGVIAGDASGIHATATAAI